MTKHVRGLKKKKIIRDFTVAQPDKTMANELSDLSKYLNEGHMSP